MPQNLWPRFSNALATKSSERALLWVMTKANRFVRPRQRSKTRLSSRQHCNGRWRRRFRAARAARRWCGPEAAAFRHLPLLFSVICDGQANGKIRRRGRTAKSPSCALEPGAFQASGLWRLRAASRTGAAPEQLQIGHVGGERSGRLAMMRRSSVVRGFGVERLSHRAPVSAGMTVARPQGLGPRLLRLGGRRHRPDGQHASRRCP